VKEILDGGTFAQELRIGSDAETAITAAIRGKRSLQLDSSASGHGTFFDHQFRRARFGGNLLRDVVDCEEIGAAIAARRSTDTNENGIAEANGLASLRGVGNFSSFAGGSQNLTEMIFVNGNLPGFQLRDSAGVNIRAHHIVTGFRETRASHQANVATTNYR
jgi:hypothetical protein